jgi:hypothetical protein
MPTAMEMEMATAMVAEPQGEANKRLSETS